MLHSVLGTMIPHRGPSSGLEGFTGREFTKLVVFSSKSATRKPTVTYLTASRPSGLPEVWHDTFQHQPLHLSCASFIWALAWQDVLFLEDGKARPSRVTRLTSFSLFLDTHIYIYISAICVYTHLYIHIYTYMYTYILQFDVFIFISVDSRPAVS